MTTITVTQEDLAEGTCGSPSGCAIALAIKRVLVGQKADHGFDTYYVQVGSWSWTVYDQLGTEIAAGLLPREAAELIANFDSSLRRRFAKPTQFELDIPAKLVQDGTV